MAETNRYTDCAAVREDLSAYFDGELLPDDRESLDAHLRDCAECLRELNALKRVDDTFKRLSAVKPPSGFESDVREAVKAGRATTFPRRSAAPRWAGPLVASAAAVIVVIGGVVLLEWQQSTQTHVALAPDAGLEFQPPAADSATFESDADEDPPGGGWDAFTANSLRVQVSGETTQSAAAETQGVWEGFVREGDAVGGVEADAVGRNVGFEAVLTPEPGSGQGRADEASSRPREVSASPDQEPVGAREGAGEDDVSDRAAVLGEPPSTLSAQRAEALKDAATESERSESEAKAAIERQADVAQESGEVVERTPLRSFKVGGDGVWYQAGYNGETTTPLPRGSDVLRELMKKYPGFDWNKMLDRSAEQVFQLDGAWYALEARQDDE